MRKKNRGKRKKLTVTRGRGTLESLSANSACWLRFSHFWQVACVIVLFDSYGRCLRECRARLGWCGWRSACLAYGGAVWRAVRLLAVLLGMLSHVSLLLRFPARFHHYTSRFTRFLTVLYWNSSFACFATEHATAVTELQQSVLTVYSDKSSSACSVPAFGSISAGLLVFTYYSV